MKINLTNLENPKNKRKTGSVVNLLIAINVLTFAVDFLIEILEIYTHNKTNLFYKWFAISEDVHHLFFKPWSIVSYAFLHDGFVHLIFNLIFLFYIGRIFIGFFSQKRLLLFYLFGSISGAIVFLLSHRYFFDTKDQTYFLLGSSSGIMSLLIALVIESTRHKVWFQFLNCLIRIEIWKIGLFFILFDVISLFFEIKSGNLAHLGGAFYGLSHFFYRKKCDLKRNALVLDDDQKKLDDIFKIISQSSYASLSDEKKKFLFQQEKKNKQTTFVDRKFS